MFCPLVFACLAVLAESNYFLEPRSELPGAIPDERAILDELEEVLGSGHRRGMELRLARMEELLRPIFAAMPKNMYGRLDPAAVRYVMHRVFVQRHGWFVNGFTPDGEGWDASSSPLVALKTGAPDSEAIFEKRLGAHGFGLHGLAIMAATLENLVHAEGMDRLRQIYHALERSEKDPVSVEESHEVLDAFMMTLVLGANFSAITPQFLRGQAEVVEKLYPTWNDTREFAREVQASTTPPDFVELNFEQVESVIEGIGERYGRWQNSECQHLKAELLAIQDGSSGRVRVAEFYNAALHEGKWQFSESVDYLRQLGALDESQPANLRVLIANYINSPSNCVASSRYYSVCCIDECEALFGHLEQQLGKPDATPAEISELVAALPSSTVAANRSLPPALLERLEDVARHHGGRVPLHGRLFAQWMHQAYPSECVYPHVTGTTSPRRMMTGPSDSDNDRASHAEMRQHLESPRPAAADDDEEYGMWTMEEELFVVRASAPVEVTHPSLRLLHAAVSITALFALAYSVLTTSRSTLACGDSALKEAPKRYKV